MPPAGAPAGREARRRQRAAALVATLLAVACVPLGAASSAATLEQRPGFWHYVIGPTAGGTMQVVWSAAPLQQGEAVQSYFLQRSATAAMPGPGEAGWEGSLESMGSGTAAADGTLSSTVTARQSSYYRVVAALAGVTTFVASSPAKAVNPSSTYAGPQNTNLTLSSNITLQGVEGAALPAVDCAGSGRALTIASSATLKGLRFVNGSAGQEGGGCILISGGSPTIDSCQFERCRADLGGAINVAAARAAPTVQSSRFSGCSARRGGGIRVGSGASIAVIGCSFDGNAADDAVGVGGAMVFDGSAPSTIRDTNMTGGRTGFTGGGIGTEGAAMITLERVSIRDNYSSSHAGGILLFGSNMTAVDCEIVNNTAASFAGGILAQYALYIATRTRHNYNKALYGAGALKLYSAAGILNECEVMGNYAPYGAGIEAAQIQQSSVPTPTIVNVSNTMIEGNVVVDRGAGIFVDLAHSVVLTNVTIANNVAGAQGGGMYCNTGAQDGGQPAQLTAVRMQNNSASIGGGIFASTHCSMSLANSTLQHNSASQHGAGLGVSDGASINLTDCSMLENGVPSCSTTVSPQAGGGIYIGLQAFNPNPSCNKPGAATAAAAVRLSGGFLRANLASGSGGGVHVAAGRLEMQGVELSGNRAGADSAAGGAGGAIALSERCSAAGCEAVSARLLSLNLTANSAGLAGGAVFFNGSNPSSRLELNSSTVTGNAASAELLGMGGGLFLGYPNFCLAATAIHGNSAFFGGGLFLATDLRRVGPALSNARLTGNKAAGMGHAAYWLRSKSPSAVFVCQGSCLDASQPGALATEALAMQLGHTLPEPLPVQTNNPFPAFSVRLLDFYRSTVTVENGTAVVSLVDKAAGSLSGTGGEEAVRLGVANFSAVMLRGTIDQTYQLQISYQRPVSPAAALSPAGTLPPALNFSVLVTPCPPGSQPNSDGNDCTECSAGTYNFDGAGCLPCPRGAACRGGSDISSLPDFWRASAISTTFHPCKALGICEATNATGDQACRPGQQGPLCDVCWQGYFKFAGSCRSCGSSGQAIVMLVVSLVLLVLIAVALFVRSWDFGHGPGVMSKVKILLSHFQMLALFRDYDVVWPGATKAVLSWFELANVGFMMLAPECFFGEYNFYMLYIFQMTLPFACVGLCVAAYYGAQLALNWKDPGGTLRAAGVAADGAVGWLEGLKIRCWKNAFWFVTLLYPRCAMTALQLFGWQTLESGTYLKADYSIMVKLPDGRLVGTYVGFMVPGILLLFLFAVLIPAFWFVTVWRHRHQLEDPLIQAKYGFLYSSYSPRLPYWETTEMLRKFAIAFIPVFVPAQVGGSLQAAVAQAVLLLYIMLTLVLRPFAAPIDNWLQVASLTVLWLLLLTAGVNKWAQLSPGGDKALAGFQLALSSGMGFALGCAVVWSGVCLLRQYLLRRAAKRRAQRSSFGSTSEGAASSSRRSGAGSAAALFAPHSRLGSAAALAAAGSADVFDELPLRILSKRGSLVDLRSAAVPAGAQAGAPAAGALAAPPPLVGLQRDSTAATGAFYTATSSFKRSSGSCSLRGLGTSTDAGEIGAGLLHSCCDAPAEQSLAGGSGGAGHAAGVAAKAAGDGAGAGAAAVGAGTAKELAEDAGATGSGSIPREVAPPPPLVPWSEPVQWRSNPLVRSPSAASRRSAAADLEAQLAQLPELDPLIAQQAQQQSDELEGSVHVAAQLPEAGSFAGTEPPQPALQPPPEEVLLLSASAGQPPSPSSIPLPGACPDPPALSAEGVHRRRTFTGDRD
ncbi:hypothetical protein ABPG75_012208 [Micractinium tetrahymenae]